jgi:hypothetical protein
MHSSLVSPFGGLPNGMHTPSVSPGGRHSSLQQ